MSEHTGDYRVYQLKRQPLERSGIHYEKSLNPEQLDAVTTESGPLLVVAGAGTGKTRTLTFRAARLIDRGLPPERIVLLTFTRRAAEEMIGRVERLLGVSCEGLVGGTYHGFASRMLRRFPPEGYPNRFTILDRGDSQDTIQLVRGERGIRRGERRFPKKATLADMFSKAINRNLALERIILDEYEQFAGHAETIAEIAAGYAAFKRKHALMDYDDLLVFLAEKLREDTFARREMRATFQHVLVDEYQDTNPLQAEITDSLAAEHRNVMAVGDDAQSIYSFRGADYRNILAFPDRYPDAKVVKLEHNYRSTQPILDVANEVIARASTGFGKQLYTDRKEGDRPAVVMAHGESDQAAFISQRVIELREEGIPLHDMAVLFRSSFQSYELELELGRRDIPFVKYGGFKFLEAAHVKDLLAHVRVLTNPQDAVSWNRLMCLIPGIGPRKAAGLIDRAADAGDPYRFADFAGQGKLRSSLRALDELFEAARRGEPRPADLVAMALAYYEPLLKIRFDDHPRRLRDLEHVQVLAEGYSSLDTMVQDMSLDPPDRAVDNKLVSALDEGERLVLSTVHSAKGMEWRVVFVLGALDGYFPTLWSTREVDAIEEERRLMYVALTRAKDALHITYPIGAYHPSAGRVLNRPSRFIEELPQSLLERWAVTG